MKYKAGDLVKIKEWDDMASEFGTDKYGDIACPFQFTREMSRFCGREYIFDCIKDSEVTNESLKYIPRVYFCDPDDIEDYYISEQMIEPDINEEAPNDIMIPDINLLF